MAVALVNEKQHPSAVTWYGEFPDEPIAPSGVMSIATVVPVKFKTAHQLLQLIAANVKSTGEEVLIVTHATEFGLWLKWTATTTVHDDEGRVPLLDDDTIKVFLGKRKQDKLDALGISEAQLKALEKARDAVVKLKLKRIEFRACHLGEYTHVLELIRKFFGAKHCGAPKLQDAYSPTPKLRPNSKSEWKKFPKSNIEIFGGKRIAYRVFSFSNTGTAFKYAWISESTDAQKEWNKKHFDKKVEKTKAIHGLVEVSQTGLIFPHDADYRTNLESV